MSHWPNFFVAGAPRCGTSSLYACLSSTPGVYMSRIKEPNFFSQAVIGDQHPMVKPIREEDDYLRLFAAAGDATVVGEATPFYLADPGAPRLIRHRSPHARVLASLRDPVERLYSHYLMMRNNLPTLGNFMEEIERGLTLRNERNLAILDPTIGLYGRQIERYLEVFGRDRFKVTVLEEWGHDVPRTLRSIRKFLGLGPVAVCAPPQVQRRFGVARGPLVRFLFGSRKLSRVFEVLVPFRLRKYIRNTVLVKDSPKPPMDPRVREWLVNYYQADVQLTERLLGRKLPWPNFPAVERRLPVHFDRAHV